MPGGGFNRRQAPGRGWGKLLYPPNLQFGRKVGLAKVIGRYCPSRTALPLVELFNDLVLEPGTGKHSRVGTLTRQGNVVLVELRLVSYLNV